MARRPNYGGEKRRKEIQKQQKREEKDEKKRLKKEGSPNDQDGASGSLSETEELEPGAPADSETES